MHPNAPALKPRPSFQRLKTIMRVGKRVPQSSGPEAEPSYTHPVENSQGLVGAQEQEVDGGPSELQKCIAKTQPANMAKSQYVSAQSQDHEARVATASAESGSPSPRDPTLMPRKSLFRLSTRFRSDSTPDERRSKDALPPLPNNSKHLTSTVEPPLSPTAKARREAALRAAGLVPSQPVKTLSEIEAEEDRRIGVVNLPSKTPRDVSEAAELVKLWRTQSTIGQPRTITDASPTAPPITPTTPSSESVELLARASAIPSVSPRSNRSQHSLGRARTHMHTGGTETAQNRLKQSPTRSIPHETCRSEDSERDRLLNYTMPRSAAATSHSDVPLSPHSVHEPSSDVSDSAVSTSDAHFFSLPSSPQPEIINSPSSPLSAAFSEDSQPATHPTPPLLVTSSSVESETSCSVGPSTPQLPHAPRGFSTHRGAPAGMAPIIIETAEDGNSMSGGALVSGSPIEDDALKDFAMSIPSSAPAIATTYAHLRAPLPSRSKSNRRSFGFFAQRTATLPPSQTQALAPASLRRGNTVNGRSASAAVKASRRMSNVPPTPERISTLSPTMHSHATIQRGMNAIEDDESRRLSELAYI